MIKVNKHNWFKDLIYNGDEPLQKDSIVLELKGEILTQPTRTSIQIDSDKHIEDSLGCFINHNCNPSCRIQDNKVLNNRILNKGDSITFDYNLNEDNMSNPFICHCCGELISGKMKKNLAVIILAAGKGTRMKSNLPKVLHRVNGSPMINRVISTAKKLNPDKIIVVVSEQNYLRIKSAIEYNKVEYVIQKNVSGTASAVLSAKSKYENMNILVLLGDVPLISYRTLNRVISTKADSVILGFNDSNVLNKFGRLILDKDRVIRIVEYNEANEEEKNICQVNSGMLYLGSKFTHLLEEINNDNTKGEYYLTDIVEIMNKKSHTVKYIEASKDECMGVNTQQDLQEIQKLHKRYIN